MTAYGLLYAMITLQVDTYAWAMICYQLFQGMPPFHSLDPVQAARAAAQHGARPEWIMSTG